MKIDDKIREENLQYDINNEVKISALSSGKIDKYEYLIGKEILPSNQSQIIEQAKFTYSPLGKTLEKQTKTTESQGEKQIKAIDEHGKQVIKSSSEIDSSTPLKEKKHFYKIGNERQEEIKNLSKQNNYDNFMYYLKTKGTTRKYFAKNVTPLGFCKRLRDDQISLKGATKKTKKDLIK